MKQSTFPDNNLNSNGQATLLRGFAAQITTLVKPNLKIVQEIGSDIGLVILRKEDFKNSIKEQGEAADEVLLTLTDLQKTSDRRTDAIRSVTSILASQKTPEEKLLAIATCLQNS
jgi:hypothetical protein